MKTKLLLALLASSSSLFASAPKNARDVFTNLPDRDTAQHYCEAICGMSVKGTNFSNCHGASMRPFDCFEIFCPDWDNTKEGDRVIFWFDDHRGHFGLINHRVALIEKDKMLLVADYWPYRHDWITRCSGDYRGTVSQIVTWSK